MVYLWGSDKGRHLGFFDFVCECNFFSKTLFYSGFYHRTFIQQPGLLRILQNYILYYAYNIV
jgi:hypothetical protein